ESLDLGTALFRNARRVTQGQRDGHMGDAQDVGDITERGTGERGGIGHGGCSETNLVNSENRARIMTAVRPEQFVTLSSTPPPLPCYLPSTTPTLPSTSRSSPAWASTSLAKARTPPTTFAAAAHCLGG